MPANRTRLRRRAAFRTMRRSQIVIAVTVLLGVMTAWSMLGYSGALDSAFRQKAKSGHTVSLASLNSNSPAKEYVFAGSRLIAMEEPSPCVGGDTQPPVFTNLPPPPVTVTAAYQCPYATSAQANYTNPPATDNSGSVTVSCNPASGSSLAVGASTVTCTATDPCNNTATCSFVVNVFSACLVDNSSEGTVVLFNAATGDYVFCCNGLRSASGRGTLTVNGCNITIHHVKGDRTVDISVSGGTGTASIKKGVSPPLTVVCQITDPGLAGDTCTCQ